MLMSFFFLFFFFVLVILNLSSALLGRVHRRRLILSMLILNCNDNNILYPELMLYHGNNKQISMNVKLCTSLESKKKKKKTTTLYCFVMSSEPTVTMAARKKRKTSRVGFDRKKMSCHCLKKCEDVIGQCKELLQNFSV